MFVTKSQKVVFCFLVGIGLTFFLGFLTGRMTGTEIENRGSLLREESMSDVSLTNPLLDCEAGERDVFKEYSSFETRLRDFVDNKILSKQVTTQVSVYFRDLNNGPWIGINEDDNFYPASLTKLALLVGTLRKADKDGQILDQSVTYTTSSLNNVEPITPDEETATVGGKYKVSELLRLMIEDSDNNATEALVQKFGLQDLLLPFKELNIPTVEEKTTRFDMVSVKRYASFYRILYNASYLTRASSEYALGLLTKTKFADGLMAGIPKKVMVAHKFGEREIEGTNVFQLHDCGIVYYPNHPYILCVMTRGAKMDDLKTAISSISKFVYEQVDSQLGKK